MEIKNTVDPVGQPQQDEFVQNFIDTFKKIWDDTKVDVPWWKFWKRINFTPVTNFLIKALDDLVAYFIEASIPGQDKKATVLDTVGKLYDYIVMVPLFLRPFSGSIRNYIINTLVSASIDWLIEKYNNGQWKPKTQEEVVSQLVTLNAQLFGVPGGHRPVI